MTEHTDLSQPSPVQLKQLQARSSAERKLRSGANWFYWIAGLSLVNSVIWWLGGGMRFLAGLAISQLVDGFLFVFGEKLGGTGKIVATIVAFTANIIVSSIFVALGYSANERHQWSFIVGMALYGLDALTFLLFMDIWSFGFHIVALFGLLSGIRALKKLKNLEQTVPR